MRKGKAGKSGMWRFSLAAGGAAAGLFAIGSFLVSALGALWDLPPERESAVCRALLVLLSFLLTRLAGSGSGGNSLPAASAVCGGLLLFLLCTAAASRGSAQAGALLFSLGCVLLGGAAAVLLPRPRSRRRGRRHR
ncbi:MAG: hypothetical protein IJU29_05735 [Oscillospiraceae bacterium]|nr:hypothetical protein [Oscillospiraceae bacterium]